ncbi:hypothetical protein KR222_011699, partial [Zaprionus bogoriensis]
MDFDEILAKCGNNGRYQYMLFGTLLFVGFVGSVQFISQNVIALVPDHWCYHDQLVNRSYEEIEDIYAQFERPSCTLLSTIDGPNITISDRPCDRWIYKYDYGYRSMNMEFNWVCDSAYKARIGQSLFFIGTMVGTLIFGPLGDRFGRVKTMILANMSTFIGEFATAFANSLFTFSITRFVSGLGSAANIYLIIILAIEYCSPKLRSVGISSVMGICISFSLVHSAGLAMWLGHWSAFMVWTSLPILLVVFTYFVVQESAQWLVTRNDIDGAIQRLRHVAKINGRTVSEEDFKAFRSHCEQNYSNSLEQEQPKLRSMLKWPRLRRRCFVLLSYATIISAGAGVITRTMDGMGISALILLCLNALSLLPSGLVQGQFQQRYGRKATSTGSMISLSLFSIALGLCLTWYQKKKKYWIIFLAVSTRFCSSMSYQSSSLFITELIPTSVRSRGVAFFYVATNLGGFITPFIQHLGIYGIGFPFFAVVLCSLLSTYLCLLLPETSNRKLAISVEESNEFGKNERMFDFIRDIRSKRKPEERGSDAPEKPEDPEAQQKLM